MKSSNRWTARQELILEILNQFNDIPTALLLSKIKKIEKKTLTQITLTRDLKPLLAAGFVKRTGKGRAVQYQLSPLGELLGPVDVETYFKETLDKRRIQERFNFDLMQTLRDIPVFNEADLAELRALNVEFRDQKAGLSPTLLKKEFERVTIELSWKSSAIEGNTYSLLETETLLREGIEAKGKKAEEARMLLNHKTALEFVRDHRESCRPLTLSFIEKVHSILVEGLDVSRNLRKTLVGITGTRYRPLDNQFQIREALEDACKVINARQDPFSRALLAILLISYIQPFEDGNKRCGRILGNALLLAEDSFPLSFRSVDETEYKKAILLFYERNNLNAFQQIFLDQARFSVENYFRSK